ncbi:MAG: hypothetical protein WDW36_005446 [Sanguina aurantia]
MRTKSPLLPVHSQRGSRQGRRRGSLLCRILLLVLVCGAAGYSWYAYTQNDKTDEASAIAPANLHQDDASKAQGGTKDSAYVQEDAADVASSDQSPGQLAAKVPALEDPQPKGDVAPDLASKRALGEQQEDHHGEKVPEKAPAVTADASSSSDADVGAAPEKLTEQQVQQVRDSTAKAQTGGAEGEAGTAQGKDALGQAEVATSVPRAPASFFDLSAPDVDGTLVNFSRYAGKVVIVVNVASACGFTDENYRGLMASYEKYSRYGLEILGFPCNQFGAQEQGSESDIKAFCSSRYHVTFPMFSKVNVNGPDTHPVFEFLKRELPASEGGGGGSGPGTDLVWNFNKFFVNRRGQPVKFLYQAFDPSALEERVDSSEPTAQALSDGEEAEAQESRYDGGNEAVPVSPVTRDVARSCIGNVPGMRDNELFASPFHAASPMTTMRGGGGGGCDSEPRPSRLTQTQSSLHLMQYCQAIQTLLDGMDPVESPQSVLDSAARTHALLGGFLSERNSSTKGSSVRGSESRNTTPRTSPHMGHATSGEAVARQLSYDVAADILPRPSDQQQSSGEDPSHSTPGGTQPQTSSAGVMQDGDSSPLCEASAGAGGGGREKSEREVEAVGGGYGGGPSLCGADGGFLGQDAGGSSGSSSGCGEPEHAHPGSTCTDSCLRLQADHEEALVCLGQEVKKVASLTAALSVLSLTLQGFGSPGMRGLQI